eukprot:gnl/MRDRNA2_/MRDRNA2_255902_c0_seq1.p1 gnl/MRDRNA2_/MRDRNA2_255902_c0~~gnl/MRDRNA2_/MRDRNA2_255902_c0_seq1.p1  ORF type:complete len:112 (+),score=0.68 gnl/MRDRNA2_/MRDRNA2_255902_c0_seq1:52-387(+)
MNFNNSSQEPPKSSAPQGKRKRERLQTQISKKKRRISKRGATLWGTPPRTWPTLLSRLILICSLAQAIISSICASHISSIMMINIIMISSMMIFLLTFLARACARARARAW